MGQSFVMTSKRGFAAGVALIVSVVRTAKDRRFPQTGVSGGRGGSHFGGPAGTTPPLLSSGGLDTSRAELVSKETMFTWPAEGTQPPLVGGKSTPERRAQRASDLCDRVMIRRSAAPRRGVHSPPEQELLGAITSHGPSRECSKPSRKASRRPAETAGEPATGPAVPAQRM